MRNKEVDDAINIVSNVRTSLMNFNELVNEHKDIIDSVETVLNYISDLEEELDSARRKNESFKNQLDECVHEDVIRDKIKELEKLNFNNYANEYDNGNEVKYYILKEFKEILGE